MCLNRRKAFDIPPINNPKEALMKFLNLDSDNETHWASVIQLEDSVVESPKKPGVPISVRVFKYLNFRFQVAHSSTQIEGFLTSFNSNHWIVACQPVAQANPLSI